MLLLTAGAGPKQRSRRRCSVDDHAEAESGRPTSSPALESTRVRHGRVQTRVASAYGASREPVGPAALPSARTKAPRASDRNPPQRGRGSTPSGPYLTKQRIVGALTDT